MRLYTKSLIAAAIVSGCLFASCGGDEGSSQGGGQGGVLPTHQSQRTIAFPGADGGAKYATGGAGGTVLVVNTLDDGNHEGTLRWALGKAGKRTIVFTIGGTIALNSPLIISTGDVTVAGQSAPGGGITIKNYTVSINASNVILRYLRFRMGDEKKTEDDALNSWHHDSDFTNIMIDHCSLSWCTDECGSFYGNTDFTLQWCVLSESLNNSVHEKGSHGYGGIWGGKNASFHHNLLAHHKDRNPRFDHDYVSVLRGPIDYVNNVVYNWKDCSSKAGESANSNNQYRSINFVNNYYKPGPATSSSAKKMLYQAWEKCDNCVKHMGCNTIVPAHLYIDGNYFHGNASITSNNWEGVTNISDKSKIKLTTRYTSGLTALAFEEEATTAFESVLKYGGNSYKRDAVDERIMGTSGSNGTGGEVRNGTYTYNGSNGSTGGIIDTQSDVKGWPVLEKGTPIVDTDNDGMPDDWERAELKKLGCENVAIQDFKPGAYNITGKYTNVEVYLNELVTKTFPAGAKANETR